MDPRHQNQQSAALIYALLPYYFENPLLFFVAVNMGCCDSIGTRLIDIVIVDRNANLRVIGHQVLVVIGPHLVEELAAPPSFCLH